MGFLSDLFAPTTQTSTKDTTSQSTSNGNVAGQSSTGVTLTPEMQQMMQMLQAYSSKSMSDPTAALAPIRNAGLQGINQSYAAVPGQVAQQLASRGYGSSGAMGDAQYKVGLARAGAAAGLEGQLATQGIQQQQFGASLGQQLLNSLKGSSTSTSGTSSSSTAGTSNEVDTKPGPSIFSSIAGLMGTIAGAATGVGGLGGLFGGGGGGGGGDYSFDPNSTGG